MVADEFAEKHPEEIRMTAVSETGAPTVLVLPILGLPEAVVAAGFQVIPWERGVEQRTRLMALASQIDAIVTVGSAPPSPELLDAATRLTLICLSGAGYERFDPPQLRHRGITLANAGAANATDVADLAIGLVIALTRRIVEADRWVRSGAWPPRPVETSSLKGKRIGIVGLGAIGCALALRAEVFGMEVRWWGPRKTPSRWQRADGLHDLARWADTLVICARSTPETEGMIDAAVLDSLGHTGTVVNVARGAIVDEAALITALRSRRIAGAALDVFSREPTDPDLWKDLPNTILQPHHAGATIQSLELVKTATVDALSRHFSGQRPMTALN